MSILPADTLHKCLVLILKPIVRLCLKRSLKIQDLLEAAKVAFLDLSEEEMRAQGAEVSMSRLSIMTGIHRRDVMRLWRDEKPPKQEGSQLKRVIWKWQQDERFQNKAGRPRLLQVEGKQSEFVDLVQSVSQDLNPYTILFELERIGAITRVDDKIKLEGTVYIPKGDVLEGFALLSADAADLIMGVEENVFEKPEIKNLHIKTEYDNVTIDSVERIKEWFLDQGEAFHKAARDFLAQFDKDINPQLKAKLGGARVALGTFSRVERPKQEAEGSDGKDEK